MGQGNFYPNTDDYRMRYYDAGDILMLLADERDQWDYWDLSLEYFEEVIFGALPKSFQIPRGSASNLTKDNDPAHHNPDVDRYSGRVIAYNGHVAIAITGMHNGGMAVYAIPRVSEGWTRYDEEVSSLALHYLHNVLPLSRVWDALPIKARIPNGAWRSSEVKDSFDECRQGS